MSVLDAEERERRDLWLGLLGVVIFATTLPMARLVVGDIQDPQLLPFFVTVGERPAPAS